MATLADIFAESLDFAFNHPEAIVLWMIAGAFIWYLVSSSILGKRIAPLVFITFIILGLGFLIGGLIYDPTVSEAFRSNLFVGLGTLFTSTIAGAFLVPLLISLVIGWGIGYVNR